MPTMASSVTVVLACQSSIRICGLSGRLRSQALIHTISAR